MIIKELLEEPRRKVLLICRICTDVRSESSSVPGLFAHVAHFGLVRRTNNSRVVYAAKNPQVELLDPESVVQDSVRMPS